MWLDQISGSSAHATFDGAGGGSGKLSSGWGSDHLGRLVPLRELSLHPASTILNYGQGLFEGIKAFRQKDGTIRIFRCDKNAKRFRDGASRLMIPPVPEPVFIEACEAVVAANAEFVPPHGAGALYLRPILFGSGKQLGVSPSPEFTFCIYCSPVGNYFKGGVGSILPIRLLAQKTYQRAANKGIGFVKAVGNYAPVFKCQDEVRKAGFNEALFLDSCEEHIEEAGASNFFVYSKSRNLLVTPELDGNILAGVTRASVIEIARDQGIKVEERKLKLKELCDFDEAFCCGTGASVTPVGSVEVEGGGEDSYVFGDEGKTAGDLTKKLYQILHDIQWGINDCGGKYKKWSRVVKPRSK